ncbi:hypothetical protein J2S03_003300 [Alicyclobacillus cycloheptanicus]|uniref:Uncharacterized protein n=1 Tax=Alicyclobacillus cycloheptanicus TaxID=1457 RepID=A0ABT9XM87_9BACL|nr:hypothetical protein [Alicyclobacillus cycloheptanicus]
MIPISVGGFVKLYRQHNKSLNEQELKASLRRMARLRDRGARCEICGGSIWAIGSAVTGWNGCFTCITGESDDSDDYEVCL